MLWALTTLRCYANFSPEAGQFHKGIVLISERKGPMSGLMSSQFRVFKMTTPAVRIGPRTSRIQPGDELIEIRARLIRIEEVLRTLAAPPPKRDFYSTSEVAERLQLSPWYVRRQCALGEIKAEKHPENGRFLIPEKELARIESRRDALKHR